MNKKGSANGFIIISIIIILLTVYVSVAIIAGYEEYTELKSCENLGSESCERDICRYDRVTNEDTESAVTACLVVLNNKLRRAK